MSFAAKIAVLIAVLVSLSGPLLAAPIGEGPLVRPPIQTAFDNQPPAPWYFGMMLRRTATPRGPGLRIDTLRNGGPASRAGLSEGDILLAVGATDLQGVRSKLAALTLLRGSVEAQPLPPGACPQTTPARGQVVLTVLQGRTGAVGQVVVEPILKPRPTAVVASPRFTPDLRPTVVSNGRSTLSIPATFNPITGEQISPRSRVASLEPIDFFTP